MCSISAIFRPNGQADDARALDELQRIATGMNRSLVHRGPDDSGIFCDGRVALAHNRLAVMDPARGKQPMTIVYCDRQCTIVYNGEIYNTDELRRELIALGAEFSTDCDTEAVLWSYIFYGADCPIHLNGIFAFLVYDHREGTVFAARDRLGVKPLYFAHVGEEWYFASEPKAILSTRAVRPVVDREGLWELLFLAPVTTEYSSVFRKIRQLGAGERMTISSDGAMVDRYWRLQATSCKDSLQDAVAHTEELLADTVRRQLRSDVPLCTFLSGGLDSSVLTAFAANFLKQEGKCLSTYSFEYEGNSEHFQSSLFQPQGDDLYARRLAEFLGTDHTVLTASSQMVADLLEEAVVYRDLPGQADIDSSLLWYCSQVKHRHTVAISGECADEIFGGYPWFYRPEMLSRSFFPWAHDPYARVGLFRQDVVRPEEGFAHLSQQYRSFLDSCPVVEGESEEDRTARRATCLSVTYFMQNLLARKDRMSMASALEVRVPYADHRILEYVYNLPWQYKHRDGVEKSLLRDAVGDRLPSWILHRKKSPYPKTHDPAYERLIRERLEGKLREDSIFTALLDQSAVKAYLDGENTTWMGQLMGRPQMIAWLLQLAAWLERLDVEFVL